METVKKDIPSPCRDDVSMVSVLEILDVQTGERHVVKEFKGQIIEAPNWLKTRPALIFNSRGCLYEISLETLEVKEINTGFCRFCNNDHVLSPDHEKIAMSHHTMEDRQSRIYIADPETGDLQLVTPMAPSYLHGWAPDGKTLAYCAERNGQYDIYTIPVDGGEEMQLTDLPGLDDGPEYAPDGKKIWFNSTRSGLMQIWNMNPDGSDPRHVLNEERNDWFPHVSPDGRLVSFVSYKKGDVDPGDHPANKNVEIRMMNTDGTDVRTVVSLFGGQGTINVNSWSPDSRKLAFVSYRYL